MTTSQRLPPAVPPRLSGAAFLAGLALATVTSAGILQERLSAGTVRVGVAVNALVTLASIVALSVASRASPLAPKVVVPQLLGAVLGVAGVHLALRCGWIGGAPWLAERPAQLVNDAASVLATLGVVWACANRCDLRLLAAAMTVALLYRMTGRFWHLDVSPHVFLVTVQDLVIAQLSCAAFAIALYAWMTREDLWH